MAKFEVRCPNCNVEWMAEDEWVGMNLECPRCKKNFVIEKNVSPAQPETSQPAVAEGTMAKFRVRCPNCNAEWMAKDEWAGMNLECPNCKQNFIVEKSSPSLQSDFVLPDDEQADTAPTAQINVAETTVDLPITSNHIERNRTEATRSPYQNQRASDTAVANVPQTGSSTKQEVSDTAEIHMSSSEKNPEKNNSIFDKIRRIFSSLNLIPVKNCVTNVGACLYLILGVVHFILRCMYTLSVTEKVPAKDRFICLMWEIGFIIAWIFLLHIEVQLFQQFDKLVKQSGKHSIPPVVLNAFATAALGGTILNLVTGIGFGCTTKNMMGVCSLLTITSFTLPILLVSLVPSNISISCKEDDLVASWTGINYFCMKCALFAAPFTWAYEALCKLIDMLPYITRDKPFVLKTPFNDLWIYLPIFLYLGFLAFHFTFTVLLAIAEQKKH